MPLLNALGYVQYVLIAIVGAWLAISGSANLTIFGMNTMTLGMIASFLTLSRSFTNPLSQISNQFNSIVTALAGASRIFTFLDEKPETDNGYVTLVNCKEVNGEIVETSEKTDMWACVSPFDIQKNTLSILASTNSISFRDTEISLPSLRITITSFFCF